MLSLLKQKNLHDFFWMDVSLPLPLPLPLPFSCQLFIANCFIFRHPKYCPLILRSLEALYDHPSVTTPVLKFFAEFVQNKTQRLQFDTSSADGILLFRVTSEVLVTFGSRVVTLQANEQNKYPNKWHFFSFYLSSLVEGSRKHTKWIDSRQYRFASISWDMHSQDTMSILVFSLCMVTRHLKMLWVFLSNWC